MASDRTDDRPRRRLISTGSPFEKAAGYSRAVVSGDFCFVSGTTGYDYETMTISEDPAQQAEQCFRNIDAALRRAGSGLAEVVRVRYIFADRRDFERCRPVFKKYFGAVRPAATMIVAGLLDERMKLEIEVTAKIMS